MRPVRSDAVDPAGAAARTEFAVIPDREQLARDGWQVLRCRGATGAFADERLFAWVRSYADPVSDACPIRPRSGGDAGTFAQTNQAAPMHTDDQCSDRPPDALVLLCVRAAVDGGESLLLPVDQVIAELHARAPEAEGVLRRAKVPFRARASWGDNVAWHRVIAGDQMVWRSDTIDGGLLARADGTGELREALLELTRVTEELTPVTVALRAGDALVVDNRRALHGRTRFGDPHRLLTRVRFNWR